MRLKRENGIALITVTLILILVSAMVVGMSWMVMTDQRLGGNNQGRETAFYGAEGGMEKLTADVGNVFAVKGAITGADLTTPPVTVPPAIPGIQYLDSTGASTYTVTCNGCPGAPVSTNATILPPSPYAGMQGLITPFTLTVAAQTGTGSEVKLQRQIQLVSIPVFQFGIFSNTDLSFFNGPPFDFGGRVHTNGNLWLAANAGPLYLGDRVTVSGQVVRSNLENGYPGGGGTIADGGTYGGTVNISTTPLPIPPNPTRPPYVAAQWTAVGATQGSVLGPTVYGAVPPTSNNPAWNGVPSVANGMLVAGAPPLNLTSTALGGITSPITLIERPTVGEQGANPAAFNQQYFSGGGGQVSLRILLDDYGPSGTCVDADMMALDTVTAAVPVDLAALAFDQASGFNLTAGKPTNANWYTGAGTFPLPLSNNVGGVYNAYNTGAPAPVGPLDGYWQTKNSPTITGCIKIEYETAGGAFTDVTQQILKLGLTGRNINFQPVGTGAANTLLFLPNAGTVVNPITCGAAGAAGEPSPNSIIRIARLRDNPSSLYAAPNNSCTATQSGYDYWPMVLYDTREGISRDNALPNNGPDNTGGVNNRPDITAQGVMEYIELDVSNLQRWFAGNIPAVGSSGGNASNVGGYEVYFSDRRGNQVDPVTGLKTGAFGFNDIINAVSDPANGCPNGAMDPGEDFVGDTPPTLRVYGGVPLTNALVPANLRVNLLPGVVASVFSKNPSPLCGAVANAPAPNYIYTHDQEARENPPVFFRHALKIVNGSTINLGTACFGAAPNPPCGLTIVAENPVYIQGEYNDGGVNDGTWTGNSVASSVSADSVTLLSSNWNDVNSFISPYAPGSRPPVTTSYHVAIIAGKGIPFAFNSAAVPDYGTDGGLHNFLRFLEGWGGTLYYRGSLVSFYYSAQGIGPYKCCATVYGAPNRQYTFDQNFTQGPQWLPPRSPRLRSINTVGFTQMTLPTQ